MKAYTLTQNNNVCLSIRLCENKELEGKTIIGFMVVLTSGEGGK